jgi:hypothetical protein
VEGQEDGKDAMSRISGVLLTNADLAPNLTTSIDVEPSLDDRQSTAVCFVSNFTSKKVP